MEPPGTEFGGEAMRQSGGGLFAPTRRGTLVSAVAAMRRRCGWDDADRELPELVAIDTSLNRLRRFAVLDPACGSGAKKQTSIQPCSRFTA